MAYAVAHGEALVDWRHLSEHLLHAEQLVRELRHLDALAELHRAADLEYELTGDSEAAGPLITSLVALVGLHEEDVWRAWVGRDAPLFGMRHPSPAHHGTHTPRSGST